MSKELGSLIVPIVAALPGTGVDGSIVMYAGNLYTWNGSGWVPNWPVYIDTAAPTNVTSTKYLWVNTSGGAGTDATLWVQDGL